jgi:hypothetical protein
MHSSIIVPLPIAGQFCWKCWWRATFTDQYRLCEYRLTSFFRKRCALFMRRASRRRDPVLPEDARFMLLDQAQHQPCLIQHFGIFVQPGRP